MAKLSFGTIIYNELPHIEGLLNNIAPYTDDIVVIDQSSTDGSEELANQWKLKNSWWKGAITWKVVENKRYSDPDRTLILSMGKYDWMFLIDADERIPTNVPFDDLITAGWDAINFPMRSLYFDEGCGYEGWEYEALKNGGREVNEGYPDLHPRLLKKGTAWPVKIHQRPFFKKEYNASEYDMLHLKTFEKQMAKNRKYVELYPDMREFQDRHCRYIQQSLGYPVVGLGE